MHVVLWRICITRNLTCSASTMLFATQSADMSSTSMGYVGLQRSPLIGVLMIFLAWRNSPRVGLTIPSSSPCQMVARIPYPATVPKYFAVAHEAAAMSLLRSSGLPIPRVYGYSPAQDNAAETEYIFMESIRGTKLSNVWLDLGERGIISVWRKDDADYFLRWRKPVQCSEPGEVGPGIPLEDERCCVGPDTKLPLWHGRRLQRDVNRAPRTSLSALF